MRRLKDTSTIIQDEVTLPAKSRYFMKYFHPKSPYILSKPKIQRFPPDADDEKDVAEYYRNRAVESMSEYLNLCEMLPMKWGVETVWTLKDKTEKYYSVYIFKSHRNSGYFSAWLRDHPHKVIITQPDCELEEYLYRRKHPCIITIPFFRQWPEYEIVRYTYGDHVAARTQIHMINHIDEGIFILRKIGASELAMRAYALHPLLQGDDDLFDFHQRLMNTSNEEDPVHEISPTVILLATEYRSVANEYLSMCDSRPIRLSPIKDVNDMLIADKIQNRKDFELFHEGHHDRTERLVQYFKEWLIALGITEEKYLEIKYEIYMAIYGYKYHNGMDAEEALKLSMMKKFDDNGNQWSHSTN